MLLHYLGKLKIQIFGRYSVGRFLRHSVVTGQVLGKFCICNYDKTIEADGAMQQLHSFFRLPHLYTKLARQDLGSSGVNFST